MLGHKKRKFVGSYCKRDKRSTKTRVIIRKGGIKVIHEENADQSFLSVSDMYMKDEM